MRFLSYQKIFLTYIMVLMVGVAFAFSCPKDTLSKKPDPTQRYNDFYDSLKSRAETKKITKWLYEILLKTPKTVRLKSDSDSALASFEGKTISRIRILRLDVFGPSLGDTSRKATSWFEKAGNVIHTRSDLHNLRKNFLIKVGDQLQSDLLYENERILRELPYIKDVRFFVVPDTLDDNLVNLTLVTQDRFSVGITGDVNGASSAALEFYNKNIFGVGHEFSTRFVGHLNREPYMGIEVFYKINNLNGKFISFSTGYMNTYLREGASLVLVNPFLRVSDTWGYGLSSWWFKRNYQLPGSNLMMGPEPVGYLQLQGWVGRNYQLGNELHNSQLTLSCQYIFRHYSDRPEPPSETPQFYFNSGLYLAGLSWTQRIYQPDELVYGYGITEDIQKGFKNEIVLGFDDNEFGDRVYGHLLLANGKLITKNEGYLLISSGISGFFKAGEIQQGLAELHSMYISHLLTAGSAKFRQFINFEYLAGFNRFEQEKLKFEKNDLIRGFESREVFGHQRLNVNMESVYFQKREFYKFNLAFFIFMDLGIVNAEKSLIFDGHYYSGFGIGLRFHNESLVFKTLQMRLSFYPNPPHDVGLVGFLLNEHTRQKFYSFQPEPPAPRRFE
jgi:hypothetical protein